MASTHGKGAKFKLNAVELQTFIKSINFPHEKDLPETTAMGDSARTFDIEGLYNATITLELMWDPAASASDPTANTAFVSTTSVACKYNPTGIATFTATSPGYTFNAWIRRRTIDNPFDDLVKMTLELQVDGAVTRDTSSTY